MTEKEFWERVFGENSEYIDGIVQVRDSPGIYTGYTVSKSLDCLFQYAVPKLNNPKITLSFYSSIRDWYCRVQVEKYPFDVALWANQEDHAHVLYNTIVKVFEQEKNDVNR